MEASAVLGLSEEQFRYQAYRLKVKSVISSLTHNSFVSILAEYGHFGGVPLFQRNHALSSVYTKS